MWDVTEPTYKSRSLSGGTITVVVQKMRWSPPLPEVQEMKWTPPRIISTPDTLGGKPRIADHRISVQDVVIWHERMKLSVSEIAAKYDLDPEDLRAALTYYANHRDQIEESIRADEAFVAEMRQRFSSTLKARRDG